MLTHLLFALVTLPTAMPADDPCLVVIVNAKNPTTEIEAETLGRMFLKKHRSWDDSVLVEPIDLDSMRQAFRRAVYRNNTLAILKYWQRMIFSGRDVPPPTARDDDEVIEHVRHHLGGVGYVNCSSVYPWPRAPSPPGIRPIKVLGLKPVSGLSVKHEVLDLRDLRPIPLLASLQVSALVVTPTVLLGENKTTRLYLGGSCGVARNGEIMGRWVALENLDAESPRVVAVEHRILIEGRLRHQAVETHELPPGHVRALGCSRRGDVEHRFALVGGS